MIKAEDIRDKLRAIPFEPFRIVTSSGSAYDVTHPDSVLLTRNVLYVGVYRPRINNLSEFPDRAATVSILHITELQPIDIVAVA